MAGASGARRVCNSLVYCKLLQCPIRITGYSATLRLLGLRSYVGERCNSGASTLLVLLLSDYANAKSDSHSECGSELTGIRLSAPIRRR